MVALVLLLFAEFHRQCLLFAALAIKVIVVALIHGELGLIEMHDAGHDFVEQISIMADEHDGVGIDLQKGLEPDGAFEVEIVGGFVQKQHIGLTKQRSRQCHAHAPAAGEGRAGAVHLCVGKAEASKNRGSAGGGSVRVDVGQSHLNFGNAVGVSCSFCFLQKLVAFDVACQNGVEQALGAARCFLRHGADAGISGH